MTEARLEKRANLLGRGGFGRLGDNLLARPLRTGLAKGTLENLALTCAWIALAHDFESSPEKIGSSVQGSNHIDSQPGLIIID